MRRSRLILFGFVFVVVVIAAGTVWAMTSIPPVEEQVPGSPVSVQIVSPLNGEFFDSQSSVSIQVYATSPNNVVSVEVWANGQLLDSQAVSQQFPMAAKSSYQWDSPNPGVQVLMARAKDAQGYTGQSSIALVTIKAFTPMKEYTTSAGDTLKSVSDFLEMDEEEIAAVNPGLDPGVPLGDGQIVKLPQPPENPSNETGTPPVLGEPPQTPAVPPNPIIFKLKQLTSQSKPVPLSPQLWGSVENCNQVRLTIVPQSDDEDGFFVYRWVMGEPAMAFSKVAVLGPVGAAQKPIEYTDTLNGLAAYYYVSAFTTAGEASSAPISALYDEGCLSGQTGQNSGKIDLKAEFATNESVNNSYCYYSMIPGEWHRLPSEPTTFFNPGQVFLELMMIVDPPPVVIHMECWGWDVGITLMYLGSAESPLSADSTNLVGESFSFSLPPLPMTKVSTGQPNDAQMIDLASITSKKVPPPINLREAEDATVCGQHMDVYMYTNSGSCQQLMDKQIKEEYLLIWDWVEGSCWGSGEDCQWLKFDGTPLFNLYMVGKEEPISSTYDPGMITPLAWGPQCFYVTASANTLIGKVESGPSNVYCPNQKNPPKVMVLQPTNFMPQANQSLYQCMFPPKNPTAEIKPGQIIVGAIDTACWDVKFQGAVKFDLNQLFNIVDGYSLQKATLRFKRGTTYYQDDSPGYEVPTSEKPLCGVNLGMLAGSGEWVNWNPTSALQGAYPPFSFVGNSSKLLPALGPAQREVNVMDYIVYLEKGSTNAGFGFITDVQRLYDLDYFQGGYVNKLCWNILQDFELEIQYYPLGQ